MILLDTNIVIAFLNGNNAVSEGIQRKIDRIALSTLVVAELDYGAKASRNARKNLEKAV
ncbi:PIN domain-containing protein [Dehalococcoidia bacterium]|nr:PIN domain-containing protein [Dehalococcoidia bacterium]